MVSVTGYDRENANRFAALITDQPHLHLDRRKWPNIPDPWPEGKPYTGPYSAGLEESPLSVWPGSKAPECYVWLGVLNNSDLRRFRELFEAVPWKVPHAVQLMLMDQEESYFRLWMIRDGKLQQYAPTQPDENNDDFWRGVA